MTATRIAFLDLFARHRVLRFLAVGVLNTCFGYVVFLLAFALFRNPTMAALISTIAGVLFNYRSIGGIVFRSNETGLLVRFVAVYAAIFVVNAGALAALEALQVAPVFSQAGLLPLLAGLSYLLNRNCVFRTRTAGATR